MFVCIVFKVLLSYIFISFILVLMENTNVIDHRKMYLLIVGILVIWIILGLFIARWQNEHTQQSGDDSLVFSTQSVGWEMAHENPKDRIACPWNNEIFSHTDIFMINPLLDKSHEIMAIKNGLETENYFMRWPIGMKQDQWNVSFLPQKLLTIQAKIQSDQAQCIYNNGKDDLFVLRKDLSWNCEAVNEYDFVGFTCDQDY